VLSFFWGALKKTYRTQNTSHITPDITDPELLKLSDEDETTLFFEFLDYIRQRIEDLQYSLKYHYGNLLLINLTDKKRM